MGNCTSTYSPCAIFRIRKPYTSIAEDAIAPLSLHPGIEVFARSCRKYVASKDVKTEPVTFNLTLTYITGLTCAELSSGPSQPAQPASQPAPPKPFESIFQLQIAVQAFLAIGRKVKTKSATASPKQKGHTCVKPLPDPPTTFTERRESCLRTISRQTTGPRSPQIIIPWSSLTLFQKVPNNPEVVSTPDTACSKFDHPEW